MKFKWVGRVDSTQKILRMFRLMWTRGTVGDGHGYSSKLTMALDWKPFGFHREWCEVFVTLFWLRFHVQRSYGGTHV
jgi:hypothetical protein